MHYLGILRHEGPISDHGKSRSEPLRGASRSWRTLCVVSAVYEEDSFVGKFAQPVCTIQ